MKRIIISICLSISLCLSLQAQGISPSTARLLERSRRLLEGYDVDLPLDTVQARIDPDTSMALPQVIPVILPAELFIPPDRLEGYRPWESAPITRPVFHVLPLNGLSGIVGLGEISVQHPDKFFSTLSGRNMIDIPGLYLSEQMILGNTLRLGGNIYMMNGILYGSQLGIMGNNWGMGNIEGFIWRPSATFALIVWNQYFRSVSVYAPVIFHAPDGNMAAVLMPATPEVFSFGVQASFVAGEFIIGIGVSVSPQPFQKRRHSELRYR